MRTSSLKIPEDLDRRLAGLAKRERVSRSHVIRAALEAFLPAQPESFATAATDLAGCASGPKDLSTASRHRADYGA